MGRVIQEALDAGTEDDFVIDDNEFFVEEHLDGGGEGGGFEELAFAFDVGGGIGADVDVKDILENNGAFIKAFGDEVCGAA